jgi:hypothetical protein
MKTVPFSDILAQVCQLVGLDRNTLNDKAFGAVRDMCSRRMSAIWDREEWPDTERRVTTFPGNPVSAVTLLSQTSTYSTIRITLDVNFPRIYLPDFDGDAYKLGKIGSTFVKFVNPFYILKGDGTRVSISDDQYNFTYATSSDSFGTYITTVDIQAALGTPEYPATYAGVNAPLTTKVIFSSNLNLLVQLDSTALQGLEAYNVDQRISTRSVVQSFLVEDFADRNDGSLSNVYQQEFSYLRFFNDNEKTIKYRQPCQSIFAFKYSSTTSYYKDAQVYYDTAQQSGDYNPTVTSKPVRGNFWIAIQDVANTLGQPPAETSSYWKMISIPYRFKDYLINGISADFLRSEGRAEEANIFDSTAEFALQQQIDVLVRQQGQVQRMNMVYTY